MSFTPSSKFWYCCALVGLYFQAEKMLKGGGLWTAFDIKYCLLIGLNLGHMIKYWTLFGGEKIQFNFGFF